MTSISSIPRRASSAGCRTSPAGRASSPGSCGRAGASTSLTFPTAGSYADPTAEHGWDHSLGEIVTALVDAGLEIRSLREYPFCEWKLDFTEPSPDGSWRLPGDLDGRMPLFFSILATKPV